MKSVSISGSLRENVGKKDAKSQRAKGLIPAVLYGNKQQKHLLIDEKAINPLIYTPEVKYVELTVGEETHKVIIQELQFHPVSDKLLHVDFLEILDNKPITIEIPILVEGSSPGVLQGGKLSKKARKIKVKGLLEHIPENIKLNISKLNILDSIKVEDVKVDNIDIVEIPSKVLVSVLSSRSVEVSEESAEGTADQKESETKE
ncbi:MAG: 50S ribosomal protein L25 [Bacteroidales bacterium]|nr:50S ribosomal protein L25 [Bacteroidales bacterium]